MSQASEASPLGCCSAEAHEGSASKAQRCGPEWGHLVGEAGDREQTTETIEMALTCWVNPDRLDVRRWTGTGPDPETI